MSDYVPLCTVKGIGTIETTKSFWRWYHQPTTDGQLSKLRYLVYNYTISITIPSKCGDTSTKITRIEQAIREGKIKPRKRKHGSVVHECGAYVFKPMKIKPKKQ